jgi:hypothetical protein
MKILSMIQYLTPSQLLTQLQKITPFQVFDFIKFVGRGEKRVKPVSEKTWGDGSFLDVLLAGLRRHVG